MSIKLSFIESTLCKILKYGRIPKHIGFIMDGNRRYAKNIGKRGLQGHKYGLESLKKCLMICLALNVQKVTLFAFAIQNFNRQQQQVNTLMQLTKTNFKELSKQKGFFQEKQIKVQIIGKKQLIRQDVRKCLQQIQQDTKNFKSLKVNLCFAYNSTFQIETAVQKTFSQNKTDIHLNDFINNMLIKDSPDIIVRTSKQVRLSDFLTFQSMKSQICFLNQNWPELSIWSFLRIIIPYNTEYNQLKAINEVIQKKIDSI